MSSRRSIKAGVHLTGRGTPQKVGEYIQDAAVFSSEGAAFQYVDALMQRDLKYRGFRDDRITTFKYRTGALFNLYESVRV